MCIAVLIAYGIPFLSLQGKPAGYKIQFWVKEEGENSMQEIDFPYDSTSGTISLLRPFSEIVLQIRVRNTLYESEPSQQVQLTTPEGIWKNEWLCVAPIISASFSVWLGSSHLSTLCGKTLHSRCWMFITDAVILTSTLLQIHSQVGHHRFWSWRRYPWALTNLKFNGIHQDKLMEYFWATSSLTEKVQ